MLTAYRAPCSELTDEHKPGSVYSVCVQRPWWAGFQHRSPALVKITCSVCLRYLCERKSQRVSIVLLPKMKKKKKNKKRRKETLQWRFGISIALSVRKTKILKPATLFNSVSLKKRGPLVCFQFNHSVVSNSLWPHGMQHASLPCPSPMPRACSNSCPLHRWCHPTISSSVIPFSSHLQSFSASRKHWSFPMSQFFASGGQGIRVSASASVLPVNIQDWFSLGWTGWIFLQSRRLIKSLLQHHSSETFKDSRILMKGEDPLASLKRRY